MVFNIYAIVIAIFIAICVAPLFYFAPEFMEGTYGDLVLASIALVVSAFGDLIGLKARLFWIPMWVWSLVAIGSFSHAIWGWWGPGITGVIGVTAIVGLLFMIRKSEQEEWVQAPRELELARALIDNSEARAQCFEHLHNAFYSPAFVSETEQMWTHQRAVLALAHQLLEGRTQLGKEHLVGMLDRAYAAKIDNPEEDVDDELKTEAEELIEHGGHPPTDDDDDD